MIQALKNGWQHPWTTVAGLGLSVLHLIQTDIAPNSIPLAAAILILGWVSQHPAPSQGTNA